MNAAVATLGNQTFSFRSETLSYEVELLERARRGDERALIDVFDAVIYDVYSYAYIETGRVDEAERIADASGAELAWIVRGQVSSLDEVRERLLRAAGCRVDAYRASQERTQALANVRAGMRHAFLAGTAVLTAVYTGVLAFG